MSDAMDMMDSMMDGMRSWRSNCLPSDSGAGREGACTLSKTVKWATYKRVIRMDGSENKVALLPGFNVVKY